MRVDVFVSIGEDSVRQKFARKVEGVREDKHLAVSKMEPGKASTLYRKILDLVRAAEAKK